LDIRCGKEKSLNFKLYNIIIYCTTNLLATHDGMGLAVPPKVNEKSPLSTQCSVVDDRVVPLIKYLELH